MRNRRNIMLRAAAYAAVFLAVVAAFAPAVRGSFLNLDDFNYVYGCPFVKGGFTWANVKAAFATLGHGGIWMPLTSMTYMADVSLFGGGWKVHHAVNVLLHGLNAVLLLRFLAAIVPRLFAGRADASDAATRRILLPCAVAALVWAFNPERSEAVAWVASRKEELWTLFALLGLGAWMRWLERGGAAGYAAAFALFALSCLAKPTAVVFPALAWLVARVGATGRRATSRRGGIVHVLPMLAVSVAVGAVAVYSQSHPTGMAKVELFSAPLWWRMLNAAVSAGLHLLHVALPLGVYADCRAVPGGMPLEAWRGLAALAASCAALWWAATRTRHRRAALFAAAWFAAGFAPVCGVFGAVGDNAFAARYSYLPAMGLAALAAYALAGASASPRRGVRAAALAAGVAVAAANLAASEPVTRSFADDAAAAERTLRFDPDNWRALRTLGRNLAGREGRVDEGVELLRRSLRLRGSKLTQDILAYTLACRGAEGDFAEARRLSRYAMRDARRDDGGMALDALGIAAMREGDDKSAAAFFSASLAAPNRAYPNLHSLLNLSLALANSGRRAEAVMNLLKLANVRDDGVRARAMEAMERIKNRAPGRFEWRP